MLATAALGGAVGSIASQGVAISMGMQDSFSWKGVAMSAIGAGAASGVGAIANAGMTAEQIATTPVAWSQAALRAGGASVATQGVGSLLGISGFSWKAVAASAAEAGASSALGSTGWMNGLNSVAAGTVRGLVSGGIQAGIFGTRPNWGSIAAQSFGQALGDSFTQGKVLAEAQRVGGAVSGSLAEEMQPDSKYSLAGSEAKFGNGGGDVRLGTGDNGAGISVATASSEAGISESDYWNSRASTIADRYAQTYGGTATLTAGSAGADDPEMFRTDQLARMQRMLIEESAQQDLPEGYQPDGSLRVKMQGVGNTTPEPAGNGLTARFALGVLHGAVDMVWQPAAQALDLGQVIYGLSTGGKYEPYWFSGIGQSYAAGMSFGETATRAVLGSTPVTAVGLASYDLTSSALVGDWGGVAEGAGGLVGGFAAGKFGQRWAAPQPGAELGFIRNRVQVDIESSIDNLSNLPGREAVNFAGVARPIRLGDAPLSRVFETTNMQTPGAKPNGSYWSPSPYGTEAAWRRGAAVQER